jgi:hypothetical protein
MRYAGGVVRKLCVSQEVLSSYPTDCRVGRACANYCFDPTDSLVTVVRPKTKGLGPLVPDS